MPLHHPILYTAAIGFLTGALIVLQDTVLTRLINKQWLGWGLTMRQAAFSTLGLATIFALGAALLTLGGPHSPVHMPAAETMSFFSKVGILMAIITPLSGQINRFIASKKATPE